MAALASGVLFIVFVGNVVIGAVTGSPIFGDVPEMLILFAASVCFVAVILRREGATTGKTNQ